MEVGQGGKMKVRWMRSKKKNTVLEGKTGVTMAEVTEVPLQQRTQWQSRDQR